MKKKEPKQGISLYLAPKVITEGRKIANKQNMSLSAFINRELSLVIEKHKKKK